MNEIANYPSLNNKVVIVTGGASGIGACIVENFLQQGSKVAFLDKEEKLGNLLKSHIRSGTLIQGSIISDMWDDIGTIERLNNLRKKLT